MKIESIELNNFAKFDNFKIKIPNQFSIVYGDNEKGKSTILDAIKLLFYGSATSVADIRKNIRKRYIEGEEGARASIIFKWAGKEYLIVRNFAKTNGRDKVDLIDNLTGEKISLEDSLSPGDYFFYMNADSFNRCLFISPAGSIMVSDKRSKNDQIQDRLLNISAGSDENVAGKFVKQKLIESYRKLINGNKTAGLILDLDNEIRALEEEHEKSLSAERDRKETRLEIIREKKELDLEEEKIRDLEKSQRILEDQLLESNKSLAEKASEKEPDPGFYGQEEIEKYSDELDNLDREEAISLEKRDELYEKKLALNKNKEGLLAEKRELEFLEKERLEKIENITKAAREEISAEPIKNKKMRPYIFFIGSLISLLFVALYKYPDKFDLIRIAGLGLFFGFFARGIFLLRANKKLLDEQRLMKEEKDKRYKEEIAGLERKDKTKEIAQIGLHIENLEIEAGQILEEEKENLSITEDIRKRRRDIKDREKILLEKRQELIKTKQEQERQLAELEEKRKAAGMKELDNIRKEKNLLREALLSKREALSKKEGALKEYYSNIRNAETVLSDLRVLKEKRAFYQLRYDALSLAEENLDLAMEKAGRNISPYLNKRTGEIFKAITGSQQGAVRIGREFDLSLQDNNNKIFSWQALSTGTAEQAYFSLRLALTEMLEGDERLPIFLDDSFIYFDDKRAKRALDFLQAYSRQKDRQMVLFSCQGRYKDWAKDMGLTIQNI